jgi:hypothetical protein
MYLDVSQAIGRPQECPLSCPVPPQNPVQRTIVYHHGSRTHLANGALSLGKSFAGESEFLTQTDKQLQQVDTETNKPLIKHLIVFALIWPVIFLSIDIYRYYFR